MLKESKELVALVDVYSPQAWVFAETLLGGELPQTPFSSKDVLSLFSEEEETYLLPKTGFDIRRQIEMWVSHAQDSDGLTPKQNIEILVNKDLEDAANFIQEYMYQKLVLNIPVSLKIIEGEARLGPTRYNDKPYVETITDKERNGSVKESIVEVENFLVNSPRGSMAIIASPPGWSGLTYHDGLPLEHRDSQTYVFRISEIGILEAVTLRSDMDLAQNEDLIRALSKREGSDIEFDPDATEKDRIINVVRKPVFLTGGEKFHQFEHVVDAIREVKGSSNAFEEKEEDGKKLEARTFEEILTSLADRKNLFKLSEKAQELLSKYKEVVAEEINDLSPESFKKMAIALGKTILEIFDSEKDQAAAQNHSGTTKVVYTSPSTPNPYQNTLEELQRVGGCAGGMCGIGSNQTPPQVSLGLVSPAAMIVKENEEFSTYCPQCKEMTSAKVHDGTIECAKGHTTKTPQSIRVV